MKKLKRAMTEKSSPGHLRLNESWFGPPLPGSTLVSKISLGVRV